VLEDGVVVDGDQGEVLGDANTELSHGGTDPQRRGEVDGEPRGRHAGARVGQRAPGRLARRPLGEVARQHPCLVDREVEARHRRPVAELAPPPDIRVGPAGEQADPPVAEGGQVLDRQAAAQLIVHRHRAVHRLRTAVDRQQGQPAPGDLRDELVDDRREGDEQTVHAALQHEARELPGVERGAVRVGHDDDDLALGGRALDAAHGLAPRDVLGIRQDDRDRPGPTRPKAAGHPVRPVAELLGRQEHALPGDGPDAQLRVTVEDPGDRRHAHPDRCCDVLERGHGSAAMSSPS
jgi:hypothetical protein